MVPIPKSTFNLLCGWPPLLFFLKAFKRKARSKQGLWKGSGLRLGMQPLHAPFIRKKWPRDCRLAAKAAAGKPWALRIGSANLFSTAKATKHAMFVLLLRNDARGGVDLLPQTLHWALSRANKQQPLTCNANLFFSQLQLLGNLLIWPGAPIPALRARRPQARTAPPEWNFRKNPGAVLNAVAGPRAGLCVGLLPICESLRIGPLYQPI